MCPPLSGCILFSPPNARAIFLHNYLLCNDTCSVNGGAKRTGGTNGKDARKHNRLTLGKLISNDWLIVGVRRKSGRGGLGVKHYEPLFTPLYYFSSTLSLIRIQRDCKASKKNFYRPNYPRALPYTVYEDKMFQMVGRKNSSTRKCIKRPARIMKKLKSSIESK